MSACNDILNTLTKLEQLITDAWAAHGGETPVAVFERDQRFIVRGRAAAEECSAESLRLILDEIRGLSHYFGSYCTDQRKLDLLVDQLFEAVTAAMVRGR